MADLRVDIKTTADLSGANAAADALNNVTTAAANLAEASNTAAAAAKAQDDAARALAAAQQEAADAAADLATEQAEIEEVSNRVAEATAKEAEATKELEFALESEVQAAQEVVETQTELNGILAETAKNAEAAKAASDAAAKGAAAAGQSANDAAKGVSNLGGSFSDMIRRGSPAHELFEGVARGSLNSSSGILALTRAVTGLFRGLSAGGLALFSTGLAAAAGAAVLFARTMGDAGKATEDAKKKFDEAKRSADALGQTELGQLNAALQKVEAQAQRDTKAFNDLNSAKEKVANADQALRLAQIQNDPRLSNEQKITAEIKTRSEFQRAADARELAASAQKVQEAKTVSQAASDNLIAPEAQLKAFDAETDRLKGIKQLRDQLRDDQKKENQRSIEEIQKTDPEAAASAQISGANISPRARALQQQITSLPEATSDQIKLSEAQADSVRKTVDAEKEKARIAADAYADAQKSYNLQKETQKTVRAITTETTRVTAQPDLVKARQTDREVKVQTANDRSNPAADKLQSTLQNLDDQIKSLRDQANNNLRSSRDPENQRLNAQADALQGQRDNTQSAFDTASRLPTKADIKRTDSSAAKTDADKALKIDTQPLEDVQKKNQAEIIKAQQADNLAIKNTATVIAAQPPIPPLDLSPVQDATISYHGQNLNLHKSTQAQLVAFGKVIRDQQSQIDALSRAQSQQN